MTKPTAKRGEPREFDAFVARALGAFLLLGGLGEFAGVLAHDKLSVSLGALHGDVLVRIWVGFLAIMSVALAVVLLRAGSGLKRGERAAADAARNSALGFVVLILVSQAMLVWRVYPVLLKTPPPEPFPGFWVLSLAVAPVGPLLISLVLALRLRRGRANAVESKSVE